jgi:hypothetical protein
VNGRDKNNKRKNKNKMNIDNSESEEEDKPPTFDVFDQRQHEYYMGQSPLLQRKASIQIEADESDPLFDLG